MLKSTLVEHNTLFNQPDMHALSHTSITTAMIPLPGNGKNWLQKGFVTKLEVYKLQLST